MMATRAQLAAAVLLGAAVVVVAAPAALAATATATPTPTAPATRDRHPLAADALQYLDGTAWTASGDARVWREWGNCTFAPGFDYNPDGRNAGVSAASSHYWMDRDQCCLLCGNTAGCAAAVYTGPVTCSPSWNLCRGRCSFRDASDVKVKVPSTKPNTSVCTPQGTVVVKEVAMAATVPGDLVTDLQNAGHISDPLTDSNFMNSSMWNGQRWTYSTTFASPPYTGHRGGGDVRPEGAGATLLVFEGVKMGATIVLNGVVLGNTTDQFVRYTFSVAHALLPRPSPAERARGGGGGANKLEVIFDRTIDTHGRFMAASGGWDWAPYSNLRSGQGHQMFTRGIWKSVYLAHVKAGSVALTSAAPHVHYVGRYPTAPMADADANFVVNTTVHAWSPAATTGTLRIQGEWSGAEGAREVPCTFAAGHSSCQAPLLNASAADAVELWWPNQMGKHTLYNVTVTFTPAPGSGSGSAPTPAPTPLVATRRVGFRFAALVTVNDTDADVVAAAAGGEGNGNHTLMLRVNGAPVMSRGANVVPMELMEGRYTPGMNRYLVTSAAQASARPVQQKKRRVGG